MLAFQTHSKTVSRWRYPNEWGRAGSRAPTDKKPGPLRGAGTNQLTLATATKLGMVTCPIAVRKSDQTEVWADRSMGGNQLETGGSASSVATQPSGGLQANCGSLHNGQLGPCGGDWTAGGEMSTGLDKPPLQREETPRRQDKG